MPTSRDNKKLDKNKIIEMLSFFKWYIWILIIGLILGNWIYIIVSKDLKTTMRNNKGDIVAHNSMIMDLKLSASNELIYRYTKSVPIMGYAKAIGMNSPYEIRAAMKSRDEIKAESAYIQDNNESIILDSFVYYTRSDMMISKNIIENIGELLDTYIIYPHHDKQKLLASVKNNDQLRLYIEATPIKYYGINKEVITYVQQIDNKKGEEIYTIIFLDVEKMYKYIESTLTHKGYYSMTWVNQPIISLQKNKESTQGYDLIEREYFNEKLDDFIQLEKQSEILNIKHTMLEPLDSIKTTLKDINRIFVATLALYLLAGGGVVILFAWQNYKELVDMFEALKGSSLKEAKNNAKIMILKNLELTTQNEISRQTIRNNIFKNLLIGHITEKDEFTKKIESVDKDSAILVKDYLQVAYIVFADDKEEIKNRMLESKIKEYDGLIKQVEWEKNKLVYIFAYNDGQQKKQIAIFLEDIELKLNEISQEISVGLGKAYSDLEKLHQSYAEAKCVAQLRIAQKEYPVLYNELITKEENLYYPQAVENKLINGILSGDKENIEDLLEFINKENIIKRKLMGDVIKHLKYQQVGTLSKILDKTTSINESVEKKVKNNIKRMISRLNNKEYIDIKDEIDDCLQESYLMILESIESDKVERVNKMNNEVMKYIKENITNPDLDMNSLVDHFEISRGNLSKIVKDCTNKNFSNYIEDCRMELANEKIKNTNIPIYAISEEVGYYSSGTFGRAYKRKYGISPTQLREKYQK